MFRQVVANQLRNYRVEMQNENQLRPCRSMENISSDQHNKTISLLGLHT